MLKGWLDLLCGDPGAAGKEQRGFHAMRKQWAKIMAGVMEISSGMVQARLSKPTGIAAHADLVNCAEGLYCSTNVYGRIRGDHADDVAKKMTAKRRKKQVSCPWAHYCEQIKDQDLFKSAAASVAGMQKKAADKHVRAAERAAAAAGGDGGGEVAKQQAADGDPATAAAANADAGHEGGGQQTVVDVNDSNEKPWGGRSIGNKAARRADVDAVADDRTIGREASAVEKLGDATKQRTMMMGFSQPLVREMAMGAAYWAHQSKNMMERDRIKVSREASAATSGASRAATDGTADAPPSRSGAAASGSPVGDVSASGEPATAEKFKVIAVDGDADIFLMPARREPRGTWGDVPPPATDGSSPVSTSCGWDSAELASSAAASASRMAPAAATCFHRRAAQVRLGQEKYRHHRQGPLSSYWRLRLLHRRPPRLLPQCGRPLRQRLPLVAR